MNKFILNELVNGTSYQYQKDEFAKIIKEGENLLKGLKQQVDCVKEIETACEFGSFLALEKILSKTDLKGIDYAETFGKISEIMQITTKLLRERYFEKSDGNKLGDFICYLNATYNCEYDMF